MPIPQSSAADQQRVRGLLVRTLMAGGVEPAEAATIADQAVADAVRYGLDQPPVDGEDADLDKVAHSAQGFRATERLMRYWAEGKGAAKIRWGEPDDFYRCEAHLGKYVQGEELKGLCANLHHRAIGVWPGQEDGGRKALEPELTRDGAVPGLTAHTGMVSLDLEPGSVPGCHMTEPHITLAFLGDHVDDEMLSRAMDLAKTVADATPGPLTGYVEGIDHFEPSEHSGGRAPYYTVPHVAGVDQLHAQFAAVDHSAFATFTPHVTMAYTRDGETVPPVPHTAVAFHGLSVHRGGEAHYFPFGGEPSPKAEGALGKVGPLSHIHGWIFIGTPTVGAAVDTGPSGHGTGVITDRDEQRRLVTAAFDNGHRHTFGYDPEPRGRRAGLIRTRGPNDLGRTLDKGFSPYELRGPNGEWIRGSADGALRTDSEQIQRKAQHTAQAWYDADPEGHDGDPATDPRSLWSAYQNPRQYQAINAVLRGNHDVQDAPPRAELAKTVDRMFDEGGTTTAKPMVLWRALRVDGGTDWAEKMKPGTTFTDTGIVSTTAQGNLAEGWLGVGADGEPDFHMEDGHAVMNVDPHDVVMEIHVPAGTRILGGSDQFIETMLQPGSRFHVTGAFSATSRPNDPLGGSPFPPSTYTRVVVDMVQDGDRDGR